MYNSPFQPSESLHNKIPASQKGTEYVLSSVVPPLLMNNIND